MAPDRAVATVSATGGFGKEDRIRNRSRYLEIYDRSAPIYTAWFVFYACSNGGDRPRLGITVPKRTGNAVCRNRIRRLVREVFRRVRPRLPRDCDLVVNAKRNAAEAGLDQVEHALIQAADRLAREGFHCSESRSSS